MFERSLDIRDKILELAKELQTKPLPEGLAWKAYQSASCPDLVFLSFDHSLRVHAKACLVCEASACLMETVLQKCARGEVISILKPAIDFLANKSADCPMAELECFRPFLMGPRAGCVLLPWNCGWQFMNERILA